MARVLVTEMQVVLGLLHLPFVAVEAQEAVLSYPHFLQSSAAIYRWLSPSMHLEVEVEELSTFARSRRPRSLWSDSDTA